MPAKTVVAHAAVRKKLQKLPLRIHQRVVAALDALQENPLLGVKLHGELAGYFKYRIGDYRIVYRFSAKKSIIEVVKIEHRQGVYR